MSQPSTQSLRDLIGKWRKGKSGAGSLEISCGPTKALALEWCADELEALLPTLESALGERQAQPAPDALSTRQIASKIFFHCLLKGEKGNPFHGMNSDWFIGLVTPKLDELFLELAARPSSAAPTESLRGLAAQFKDIGDQFEADGQKERALAYRDCAQLLAAHEAQQAERIAARPHIVCLCGSGRFMDAFNEAEFQETLAGHIVLTIGCNTKDIARSSSLSQHKPMLDELHKRKIDLADEVFVLNVGGYIGESTRSEIEHAERTGKPVRYLEAGQGTSRASRQ